MTKQLFTLTATCIQRILSKCNKNGMLRVTVDSGGCNGFSYNYKFDDKVLKDDFLVEQGGAKVIVDSVSVDFIEGSIIDYRDEMIRSGFIIDSNPNAGSACGCSSSFSLKD